MESKSPSGADVASSLAVGTPAKKEETPTKPSLMPISDKTEEELGTGFILGGGSPILSSKD